MKTISKGILRMRGKKNENDGWMGLGNLMSGASFPLSPCFPQCFPKKTPPFVFI